MLMLPAAVGPLSSPDFAVSLDLEDGEGVFVGLSQWREGYDQVSIGGGAGEGYS